MHDSSCFVTLTFDDAHLDSPSLDYRLFQLFMKRVRKTFGPVRFYMCGEYGEQFGRPHFHACLFGLDFEDKQFWKDLSSGSRLYVSPTLVRLWPHGFSSIGDVTFESAAYVARYVMKKVNGPTAKQHYSHVDSDGVVTDLRPEFTRMSLKPGIGATWIKKFISDVYTTDACIVNGLAVKPPRFYDKYLSSFSPIDFESLELSRYNKAIFNSADNASSRLRVRELVTRSRLQFKKRSL